MPGSSSIGNHCRVTLLSGRKIPFLFPCYPFKMTKSLVHRPMKETEMVEVVLFQQGGGCAGAMPLPPDPAFAAAGSGETRGREPRFP